MHNAHAVHVTSSVVIAIVRRITLIERVKKEILTEEGKFGDPDSLLGPVEIYPTIDIR